MCLPMKAASPRAEVCRRLTAFSIEGTTRGVQRKTLDLAAHFRHAENWRKRLLTAGGGVQDEVAAVDAASLFAEKTCTAVLLELHATCPPTHASHYKETD